MNQNKISLAKRTLQYLEKKKLRDINLKNFLSNSKVPNMNNKIDLILNINDFFDFKLKKNLLTKEKTKDFIYTGCQILNKDLFKSYKVESFPISEVWEDLLKNDELNGFESLNKFYHLTNLEIFKKLKDL